MADREPMDDDEIERQADRHAGDRAERERADRDRAERERAERERPAGRFRRLGRRILGEADPDRAEARGERGERSILGDAKEVFGAVLEGSDKAKTEVVRLMNWQVAWEATQGVLDIGHCSALKVYGSELNMEGYQLLMEVLGPVSYLEPDAPGAVLKSRIQQGTRGAIILTFGGGVNEMQRDLISQFTLGFPRADR